MCHGVYDEATVDILALLVPVWGRGLWRKHRGDVRRESCIFLELLDNVRGRVLWIQEEYGEHHSLLCCIVGIQLRLIYVVSRALRAPHYDQVAFLYDSQ